MLDYNNLVDEAKKRIPLFKTKYDELLRDDIIDKDSGNHIVFGYAFTPVLISAIESNDKVNTELMFDFLEDMSTSDDIHVVEVCDQSVLEALNDDIDDRVLINLMKPNTIEGYKALKDYMY